MQNIILTGATGFIGSYLLKEFLNRGYNVYCVVRPNTDKMVKLEKLKNVYLIQKPLEQLTTLDFPNVQYSAFFHLGWCGVNITEINDHFVHETNLAISKKCITISSQLGCKYFIDTGSRAEYGSISGVYEESKNCMPYDAYGKFKYEFYKYAYSICPQYDIKYVHLRLFSVIGVGDHPWSLISTACRNLIKGKRMTMGTCRQFWNFMDVEDTVCAICEVYNNIENISEKDNRIFNIAGFDTRILRSFIEEISIISKTRSVLEFNQEEVREQKNISIIPDITKLVDLTNWKPRICFHDSINTILFSINDITVKKIKNMEE